MQAFVDALPTEQGFATSNLYLSSWQNDLLLNCNIKTLLEHTHYTTFNTKNQTVSHIKERCKYFCYQAVFNDKNSVITRHLVLGCLLVQIVFNQALVFLLRNHAKTYI